MHSLAPVSVIVFFPADLSKSEQVCCEELVRLNIQNACGVNSPSVKRSQLIFSFFLFHVEFKSTLDLFFSEFILELPQCI